MLNKLLGIAKSLPNDKKKEMIESWTKKHKDDDDFEIKLADIKKAIDYDDGSEENNTKK